MVLETDNGQTAQIQAEREKKKVLREKEEPFLLCLYD